MLDRVCMKRRIIKRLMSLSKQLGMFSIILLIDLFFLILIILEIVFLNQKLDEEYFFQ